jgi:hypothetical protein
MQTQRKDLSTILNLKSGSIGAEIKQQPKYKGMFSAMGTIVREEGARVCCSSSDLISYQGLFPLCNSRRTPLLELINPFCQFRANRPNNLVSA